MFTFVYDKENGHQQDKSWYVYIFTENALKRLHNCVIIFHDNQISHLVFLYVSWLNDTYSNWTATEKTCPLICNIKGPDQPAHSRSLISNFVICFLRRIILRLASCEKISTFYLACFAEGTGLRLPLSETQKTGFLALWPVLLARQIFQVQQIIILKTNLMRSLHRIY